MEQPSSPARRWPLGVVLITVVLAVLVISTYRPQNPAEGLAVVGSATLAGAAAFVAGRRLLGTLWGLILALMLVLHPLYSRSGLPVNALGAEALKLVTLAGLVTSWRYAFSSRPRVGRLLAVGLVLALAGGLAWLTAPVDEGSPAGLVVFVLDLVALALAAGLALQRRAAPAQPGALYPVCVVFLAVVVAAGGGGLGWSLGRGGD